jgi:hypothetical protein
MRADMAAAFCDMRTTGELYKAIERGDVPRPTALRGAGKTREPVWARLALEDHLARRHGLQNHGSSTGHESIEHLV